MKNFATCLWFDNNAVDAVKFYTSIFKNSKVGSSENYEEEGAKMSGKNKGDLMTVGFELEGQKFMALNGGPMFKFTPAISFFVGCKTKKEIDSLWKKLSEDGKILMKIDKYPFNERYGWVQDKFGVTWQLMLGKYDQKITPMLFYSGKQLGKAEEAIRFYASIFPDSEVTHVERYSKEEGYEGTVKFSSFKIAGQQFMAMDSHNENAINFNEAISLMVNCETQEEIDSLWEKLSVDGEKGQCGWLKDKYGVSWQIVPTLLEDLMQNADAEASERVMKAVMSMTKLEIDVLQQAYDGTNQDAAYDDTYVADQGNSLESDLDVLQKEIDSRDEMESQEGNSVRSASSNNASMKDDLVITHIVDAPRSLVWSAFTQAEHLKQWWGPKGFLMQKVDVDLRPEGHFHYSMVSPEEQVMWGKFIYKEIVPQDKLVFINFFSDANGGMIRHPMSATWPLQVHNVLTLSDLDGKTVITITGHPINANEIEMKTFYDGKESIQKGFEGTWEQLDAYLEKFQFDPDFEYVDIATHNKHRIVSTSAE